jgi:serine-type D-Ala-D-Ala carboxypeptidase/endopeptidase
LTTRAIGEYFRRPLRKIPGAVVGVMMGGREEVTGLGSLASHAHPGGLRWEIGSITKVFTSLLLADMVGRGEVALEDPIGAYLPLDRIPDLAEPTRQPTLRDLASHTSGLPSIPEGWHRGLKSSEDPYASIAADDIYLALGADSVRPTHPRFRYSNLGAGLLGLLLSNAAGKPYEILVAERVLQTLGMNETGFDGEVVQGFRRGKPTPPWSFDAMAPAGAIRSTARDMLKFAAAVIEAPSGAFDRSLRMTIEERFEIRKGKAYVGLGWQIRSDRDGQGETFWHNGGTYATASFLGVNRDSGVAVVAFGNRGPGPLGSPLDRSSWKLLESLEVDVE